MKTLQYTASPDLQSPIIVAGFGGWGNAGEVATSTIDYLVEHLEAKPLASLSFDHFQLFSLHRPLVTISHGHLKAIDLSASNFFYWKNPHGKDLILFRGPEPHIHWHSYVQIFVQVCHRFGVTAVFTLGGLHDEVLHSEEKISAAAASMDDIQRLRELQEFVHLIDYVGPTAIHSLLLATAREEGLQGISLWGHAASYLQGTNYKLCAGMIRRLGMLLNLRLDTTELDQSWRLLEEQIENLIARNEELKQHIAKLKSRERGNTFRPETTPSPGKVIHLDRFTRKKDPQD